MDRKIMIILGVVIAVVAAGCVTAVALNYDPDMKTASFDGIKMSVPKDAEFTETIAGFEDNKYGITVQTFDDNASMVNYLKSIKNAKMISIDNQPPNSVAYEQDDKTFILITNGEQGICVGAIDQELDLKMANSVVFENGKKAGLDQGFFGIGAKHLDIRFDFNLMLAIIKQVDTNIFNVDSFNTVLSQINNENNTNSTTIVNNTTASEDDPLTQAECENIVNGMLVSGDSISGVSQSGDSYIFSIQNSAGDSCGSITVNAKTGAVTNNYSHVEPDTDDNVTDETEPTETEVSEVEEIEETTEPVESTEPTEPTTTSDSSSSSDSVESSSSESASM